MDAPGLLLAALLCAEVAAVGLAVRLALHRDPVSDEHVGRVVPVKRGEHGARADVDRVGVPSDGSAAFAGPGVARVTFRSVAHALSAACLRCHASRLCPLVALLTFALADELACLALHAALDGAPRPLAGWYRAGWHVSIALSLGWPAVLVLATWATKTQSPSPIGSLGQTVGARGLSAYKPAERRTGGKPSTDFLLGAYLGTLAGLAIVYPPSRAGLRWTLLAWELACVALAWWGLWRARGRTWGAVEVCLVVLVACESAVCIVGPFASDPFTRWWIARAFYLGAWELVSAVLIKCRIKSERAD